MSGTALLLLIVPSFFRGVIKAMDFGIDIDNMVQQIIDAIKGVFNDAIKPIVDLYDSLRNTIQGLIDSVNNQIANLKRMISDTYNNIKSAVQDAFNGIISFFKRVYDSILVHIYAFGDDVIAAWVAVERWVAEASNSTWKFISSTWERGKQTIITLIVLIAVGWIWLTMKRVKGI